MLAQLNSALILLPFPCPSRSFHVRKTQMGKRAWKGQSEISSQGETPSQGVTQGTAKPGLLERLKCFSRLTYNPKGVPGSRSQTPSYREHRGEDSTSLQCPRSESQHRDKCKTRLAAPATAVPTSGSFWLFLNPNPALLFRSQL